MQEKEAENSARNRSLPARTDETALLISLDCAACRVTIATVWNDVTTRYCHRCGGMLRHAPGGPCACKRCAG